MVKRIDLNTDSGESYGRWRLGNEEELFKYVTSANVACGFHAGDPLTIWRTVKLAKKMNVAVGAHPGFPDLMGFGRREMQVGFEELKSYIVYQLGALGGFLRVEGLTMQHVKVHGALYNMAWVRRDYARTIAEAVAEFDRNLILVAPYGSEMARAGEELGLRVAWEAFIDRVYTSDGRLAPRSTPGSLITDVEEAVKRAVSIVDRGEITSVDGKVIEVRAHTLCIHGDTPNAVELARAVRKRLEELGVEVVAMSRIV